MNPPQLQRLVAQFLLLAAFASSATFALSTYIAKKGEALPEEAASDYVPQNAYVEKIPGTFDDALSFGESGFPNLTEGVAQAIVGDVFAANPEGPQEIAGEYKIAPPPTVEKTIVEYAKSASISISELDRPANILKIKVKKDFSEADAQEYFATLEGQIANLTEKPLIRNLEQELPTEETLLALSLAIADTKAGLYATEVPESFLKIHALTIELFESQYALMKMMRNDPLKATLFINTAIKVFESKLYGIQNEAAKLASLDDPRMKGIAQNVFLKALGINVAHAQFAVYDPPAWVQRLLDWLQRLKEWQQHLIEWLAKVAVEWLKNRLVREFTTAIVAWATGQEYKPGQTFRGAQARFVTQWEKFLARTVNAAGGDIIREIAPSLCTEFGSLLQVQYNDFYFGGDTKPATCTLTKVVQNIERFNQRFSEGGWIGYSQRVLPSGNYYGSLWVTGQLADFAARKAEEAKSKQAESGGGYTGTEKCITTENVGPNPLGNLESDPDFISASGCTGGVCQEIIICRERETTTPGQNVKDAVSRAIQAPIDRIVNATEWKSLLAALLDSVAAKLFAAGDDGLLRGNITGRNPADGASLCRSYATGTPEHADCMKNITNPPIETDYLIPPIPDDLLNPTIPECKPDPANPTGPPICEIPEPEVPIDCSKIPSDPGVPVAPYEFLIGGEQHVVPAPGVPNPDGRGNEARFRLGGLAGHYPKFTIEYDQFISELNPQPTHLFQAGFDFRNVAIPKNSITIFGTAIAIGREEGQDFMRFWVPRSNEKAGGGKVSATWKPQTWYRFRIVYDATANRSEAIAIERDTGVVVSQITADARFSFLRQGSGYHMIIGGENHDENVYHMEGAIYENIRVVMEAGEKVCNLSGGGGGGGGGNNNLAP